MFRPPSSNFFTSSSEKSIHLVDLRSTCEKKLQMVKTKTKAADANIYAIVGSDEAEVKRVAAELASNLTPSGAGDFGLETIDGAADNAEQAAARVSSTIDALQTLPFFGSTKVVWLKNVNFLGDDPKARSTAVQSAPRRSTPSSSASTRASWSSDLKTQIDGVPKSSETSPCGRRKSNSPESS